MEDATIEIIEQDNYWHVQFYVFDPFSSTLQRHVENTNYRSIHSLYRKSRRKGKKIYQSVIKKQQNYKIGSTFNKRPR